jgi:hypothetical protein
MKELKPILNAVKKRLKNIKGVVAVGLIPKNQSGKVLKLEETIEQNSPPMFRVYNEGLREVLKREIVIAILHNEKLRHPPKPIIILTVNGTVIGEEVWERSGRLERLKEDLNVIFLTRDFVIYKDKIRMVKDGKNLNFILPPNVFPELHDIRGIKDIVSASPSALTDDYIKKMMRWKTKSGLGTVLIGFNLVQ